MLSGISCPQSQLESKHKMTMIIEKVLFIFSVTFLAHRNCGDFITENEGKLFRNINFCPTPLTSLIMLIKMDNHALT